jgi:hypothetical protein
VRARGLDRLVVARVEVAEDARAGIGRQHALEPLGHLGRTVGHNDHARVDRVSDPDAAAMVDADPGRAGGHVQQGVQDRPVGDRVGAVLHGFRLAVRRRDGAGVEVVAPDHDRGRHASGADELVDRQPCPRTVTKAEPADPGRQALEGDPARGELEPALEERVIREQLLEHLVDRLDVAWIAGECRPAERANAAAEERTDIGRDEARV